MTEANSLLLISTLAGWAYFFLTIIFILIVIMRRRPVGVSLSWLLLLFILPGAGIVLFLLFGNKRLGTKRLRRVQALAPTYLDWIHHMRQLLAQDKTRTQLGALQSNRVYSFAEHTGRIPATSGNRLRLFHNTQSIYSNLIKDIDSAGSSILMEFYILETGGWVDQTLIALKNAAQRGVTCRLLLDAVGSSTFLRSEKAMELKAAGIHVQASLPVGPIRMLFERIDLRNHRKLVIIDDLVAWTGSLNLVDPALFKQEAGVGQWIDAMVRIAGPAAHVNGSIFNYDWVLETGENIPIYNQSLLYNHPADGDVAMHVVPSGPGADRTTIHMVLLCAIYESQKELIITTPYLVPDEALVTALCSAAMRGVKVTLITPENNDSRLVHYASRSYYDDLLQAGICIMHFKGGLLHTKCVLIDQKTVLFGTVNLDMRSVWLNFEITLIIYNEAFGQNASELLEEYIVQSQKVSPVEWQKRAVLEKLRENTAQLLSPLL